MKSKRENPPAATGGLWSTCERLAAKNHRPEIAQAPTEIQNRRVIWIARRFRLPPTMAVVIADIAFGEHRA
jgi:hypothetical protein